MFRSIYWYGKGYAWTLIKSLSDIKKINKMEEEGKLEERDEYIYQCSRRIAHTFLKDAGIEVNVEGLENIPDGPVLFVCNHQSNMDIPVIMYSIDRPKGFIAKKELEKMPILKDWIILSKAIFIDREHPKKAMAGIIQGIKQLKVTAEGKPMTFNDCIIQYTFKDNSAGLVTTTNHNTITDTAATLSLTFYQTTGCHAIIPYPLRTETVQPTPFSTPFTTPYTTPEETPFVTPAMSITPEETPFTTPIETPFITPFTTPIETPYKTPLETTFEETFTTSEESISTESNDPANIEDGDPNNEKGDNNSLYLIIGIVIGVIVAIAIAIILIILFKKKKKNQSSDSLDSVSNVIEESTLKELDDDAKNAETVSLFTSVVMDESDPFKPEFEENFFLQ